MSKSGVFCPVTPTKPRELQVQGQCGELGKRDGLSKNLKKEKFKEKKGRKKKKKAGV